MNRSAHSDRPVFIVGAPRSGTTLLQFMLRSHPHISIPPEESHFLVPLLKRSEAFGRLETLTDYVQVLSEMKRIKPRFFAEELQNMEFDVNNIADELLGSDAKTVADVIHHVLLANAQGEGKMRWGDKTPYYSLHIPLLAKSFPSAQFIHIVRDGRDCALSMLQRRWDLGIYNIFDAAETWKQYVEAAAAAGADLGAERYLRLRYEDLVTDPVNEMKAVCEFLGEPYSDQVVNYRKTKAPGKTPLLQKPVQSSNIEKWRHDMSHHCVRVFEAVAGDVLERFGYPLLTEGGRIPALVGVAYKVHTKICREYNRRFR